MALNAFDLRMRAALPALVIAFHDVAAIAEGAAAGDFDTGDRKDHRENPDPIKPAKSPARPDYPGKLFEHGEDAAHIPAIAEAIPADKASSGDKGLDIRTKQRL